MSECKFTKKDSMKFIISKIREIEQYKMIKHQIMTDIIKICQKKHINIYDDFIKEFNRIK